HEPLRKLKQQRAQLARRPQRLERQQELPPDLVLGFGRKIAVVHGAARFDSKRAAHLRRQHLGIRLMLRQEPERLDVEYELRRRALRPEAGVTRRRERVVRAVDLDDGKALSVVAQPLLRGLHLGRIKLAAADQARIRPGGRADEYPSVRHAPMHGSGRHSPRIRDAAQPACALTQATYLSIQPCRKLRVSPLASSPESVKKPSSTWMKTSG